MSVSKIVTSTVMALSLVAVPTLASAAPAASKLSIAAPTSSGLARAGAQTVRGNKAMVGKSWLWPALLGIGAIATAVLVATKGSGNPVSR